MRLTLALAASLLATLTLAAPQTPDEPVSFYAEIFHDSSDCSAVEGGRTSAYLGSRGPCVDIAAPGTGSAVVRVGEAGRYYLAGWTEPGCAGEVVLVESNVGSCVSLGGRDVASWSNDEKPFGF